MRRSSLLSSALRLPADVSFPRLGMHSWKQAQEDGWVPGETLFGIEEAINKGTVIMNLLSDAAQSQTWSQLAPLITKGKTLYFSHGFSVVYDKDVSSAPGSRLELALRQVADPALSLLDRL